MNNLQRAACVSTPAVLRDQRLASLYMEQDLASDGLPLVNQIWRLRAQHQRRRRRGLSPIFGAVWFHKGWGKKNNMLDKQAICKLCNMRVKYCGNTTNLRKHLTRHHPAETQSTRPKQTSLEQILAPKLPANSQRVQTITEAVAGFLCKDIRPYRAVEDGSNSSLLTAGAGA